MLQSASVGHEVSVCQLALPLPLPLHQAAVEPVHGVRGDGLGVVVAGEVVVQSPDWPGLRLGLGQREGELTVVQHLESVELLGGQTESVCLPCHHICYICTV